jgi:hypothetical protein
VSIYRHVISARLRQHRRHAFCGEEGDQHLISGAGPVNHLWDGYLAILESHLTSTEARILQVTQSVTGSAPWICFCFYYRRDNVAQA